VSWHFFNRPLEEDRTRTSLTFTDVIFGLVIRQIFVEAIPLSKLSLTVKVHLALALVVVVGSYIGYRSSLKRGSFPLLFFNIPLIRFILDLVMIFLYYLLTVTPDAATNPSSAVVSARFDSTVVTLIFALFLLWDFAGQWMESSGYPVTTNPTRTWITFAGWFGSGVVLAYAYIFRPTTRVTLGIDSALILISLVYRWLKDSAPRQKKSESTPTEPLAAPIPVSGADAIAAATRAAEAASRTAESVTSAATDSAAAAEVAAKAAEIIHRASFTEEVGDLGSGGSNDTGASSG